MDAAGTDKPVVIDLLRQAKYDYGLIRRALDSHDQGAFAELMERYREPIYYMLLKMVHDGDDAEDLMIETFGKAFRRLKQYSPQFAFSTWLFKIASNGAIDFIRKKRIKALSLDKGFTDAEGDTMEIQVADDGLDPGQTLEKQQRVNRMREVVAQLKPRYRRLVELRYFEEYSYDEISKELDLPLGTVKAQLFRARDILAGVLEIDRGTSTWPPERSAPSARWTPWRRAPTSAPPPVLERQRINSPARPAVRSGTPASTSSPAKTSTVLHPARAHSLTIARVLRPNPARASSTWAPEAVSWHPPRHRLSRGQLHIVRSIGKKIKVVNAVSRLWAWAMSTGWARAESLTDREPFDL